MIASLLGPTVPTRTETSLDLAKNVSGSATEVFQVPLGRLRFLESNGIFNTLSIFDVESAAFFFFCKNDVLCKYYGSTISHVHVVQPADSNAEQLGL